MTLFHLFLVAVIQGITEFLPISSSGHLILLPNLTGMEDQGLLIDVAVHVGTLFAVVIYFWADVKAALFGLGRLARGKVDTEGAKLAWLLIVATVPVVIVGLIFKVTGIEDMLRSTAVIGWTMLIFGIVLYWADQKGPEVKTDADWNLRDALIMGFWQAVALIPGTSRSGITITAARQLGYQRTGGAKLSMLMSIPTIAMAGGLLLIDIISEGKTDQLPDAGIAAVLSFLSALVALVLMFRLLKSVSFTPYVIYRIVLGVILLAVAYS
ncbi:undecaprenyl-diphosphate phosphatase [Mangrovicoccus sp. HB161399]|uniref:undecaprenyl-diphosphate phosphatase n=1 Tax=Mangrovicoccus sp. HB161399 TaxID=2720392 RepID=UPI001553ADCA|nr:undecaprenyl-diphosphate phosphatase [Mangrovicoccus sp. HB161399]